jgi:phage tail-like protein
MNYDIKKDVPPYLLTFEDTRKFVEIFQGSVESIHEDISGYVRQFDLEKCDEEYLDLMLYESGWNLKIELTENLKRKVVKIAYYMYNKKGSEDGLEFALGYLSGLPIQVNDTVKEGFKLGGVGFPRKNSLGIDTKLGFGGFYLHFIVHTPPLDAFQLSLINKVTSLMKWALNTYEIKQDIMQAYHEIISSPNQFVPSGQFDWGTFFVNFSINVVVNGTLYQVVFSETGLRLWSDVVVDIQTALRALTGGLETVTIVDNKIKVASEWSLVSQTVIVSYGTKPGVQDFIAFVDSAPGWNLSFGVPYP